MQLFIDSSDLDEICEALQYGVSGVTTNPTTMAKAAEGFELRAHNISGWLDGQLPGSIPVSLQVTEVADAMAMFTQGVEYSRINKRVVVKCPATSTGLSACRKLHIAGIKTNVTLIFQPTQALIAAQNGAWCVSPFLCRWKDWKCPGWKENPLRWSGEARGAGTRFLHSIVNAVKGTDCKVLAASIRSVEDVEDAIEAGCDICTVSLKVLKEMMEHPKTDEGLAKFMADWVAGQK